VAELVQQGGYCVSGELSVARTGTNERIGQALAVEIDRDEHTLSRISALQFYYPRNDILHN
jgi:hypothetical protein